MNAAEILEAARQLTPEEQAWLVHTLQEKEFADWQRQFGEPEPGYDEWVRAGVEETLADDSPGIPHDEVMGEMDEVIEEARRAEAGR